MTIHVLNSVPNMDRDALRPGLFDLAPLLDPTAVVRADTEVGPLWLHAHDTIITPWIQQYHTWEPETTALLRAELRAGMHVLDIGANIGYHTLLCAECVGPEGRVIALEPEPNNFALLCANVWHARVTHVEPLRVAAAAYNGRVMLSLLPNNTGDHRTFPNATHGEGVAVPCMRVDDLLNPATVIDFVKLDIQGSDHYAIQGLERTLARTRPPVVVEFWPHGIREMGDEPTDVLRYYRSLGYTLSLLETPSVDYTRMSDIALVDAASAVAGGFGTLLLRPHGTRTFAKPPNRVSTPPPPAFDALTRDVARLHAEQNASRIAQQTLEQGTASFQRTAAAHLAALTAQLHRLEEYQDTLTTDIAAFQRTATAHLAALTTDVAAFQQTATAHLAALTSKATRLEEYQVALTTDSTTFQQNAVAQFTALMERVASMDVRLMSLDAELHSVPYMTDPVLLHTHDSVGRPTLGFTGGETAEGDLYRNFEEIFRGPEEFIRERQRVYLPLIGAREPVVDIGCGRGEFLDLLADANLTATGVDLDASMVERCIAKGHHVVRADGVRFLSDAPEATIGVIFAAQLIEHLAYDDLITFLRAAHRVLIPGGVLIAETVNPHSLPAYKTFWVDLTHRSPIFPEVAVTLCGLTGFADTYVLFPNGEGNLEVDRRTQGEYAVIATKATLGARVRDEAHRDIAPPPDHTEESR